MEPTSPLEFKPGPSISPAGPLLDWLNQIARPRTLDGRRRVIRLPVVVVFRDAYRLGLGDAYVGEAVIASTKERLRLDLDDGAMALPLLEQVRPLCLPGLDGCAVWLQGYWGPLVEFGEEEPGNAAAAWPFAVTQVLRLCDVPTRPNENQTVWLAEPSP